MIMDKNYTQDEIKDRLNFGNAYYHVVHNLLSSCLLPKNIKIKIYKIRTLHLFLLGGSKVWSLTLRDKYILKVFENGVLRGIFGPKRDEATGGWRKLHNEELHNFFSSSIVIRIIK
jgi:hypothetical protein